MQQPQGPPPVSPFFPERRYTGGKIPARIEPREAFGYCGLGASSLARNLRVPSRGFHEILGSNDRYIVIYYCDTRRKAYEAFAVDGRIVKSSSWNLDGTVRWQSCWSESFEETRVESPPWLWDVVDQTAPSMPAWMKDDEKWQAALDAQH